MSELTRWGDMSAEPSSLGRWVSVLVPASQLAERIADTEFVPAAMRGKPDVVTAAIMYGDEIGVGPMQALAGIHVVDGRPQPSAELMRALIRRAGHRITIHASNGEMCRVSGLRFGEPESERVVITWTIDMARSAGLVHKQNWQKYPRAMLLAAATRDLARVAFPDVIKGLSGGVADDAPGEWDAWAETAASGPEAAPVAPPRVPPGEVMEAVKRTRKRRVQNVRLPEPGHHTATEDNPGPDGSWDVPLPESVGGPPEPEARLEPGEPESQQTRPDTADSGPGGSAGGPNEPDPGTAPDSVGEADPGPPHLGLMGDRQRRAVFAAFERIGVTGGDHDRDRRLRLTALMLGRDVDSWRNLTRQDGFTITRLATDIETGALLWDENAGSLTRPDQT